MPLMPSSNMHNPAQPELSCVSDIPKGSIKVLRCHSFVNQWTQNHRKKAIPKEQSHKGTELSSKAEMGRIYPCA